MNNALTFADLVHRWVYTRYGLQKLRKRDPEFPEPFRTFPGNRGNLWRREEIVAYEAKRPELLSETTKKRKVARYAHCIFTGRS